MICAIEWKRLFSALKILKNRLYRGTLQYSIFPDKSSWLTCVDIFSQVGLKSGVWKSAYLLSSCIHGFFFSPRSYMINVLKINCGLLPYK